ncbi:RNA 2'-O ribose methyltransferase substrate binding family protein [Mycobacterium xenopi 4042]|uniref:RNA 2'-O ribose methyltransferase substrate binding family protein n=1 Tax=Mycobacterium xenopi 4042 TaxID=1299334 RepID=X7ZUL6_MYCXE|nr:RNA 2'-O ribose methyltransferase substrate binding family protein [Mycobacterium xenopi 4042]
MRPYHPAAKRAKSQPRKPAKPGDDTEVVLGRNPVLECLRAGVPATALYVALGTEADERLTESIRLAADSGIAILEVPRTDLDRITTNGLHQGIALQVPPYRYAHPTTCSPPRWSHRRRCWSRWTTSPIRATWARSCARWRRSPGMVC